MIKKILRESVKAKLLFQQKIDLNLFDKLFLKDVYLYD